MAHNKQLESGLKKLDSLVVFFFCSEWHDARRLKLTHVRGVKQILKGEPLFTWRCSMAVWYGAVGAAAG